MDQPVTAADITAAARRLFGIHRVTPLLESEALSDRIGRRTLFKAECLQRTGSFKFRGAFNALASMPEETRRRGVIAFSSGNHAQAVAVAARHFGVPATIVMPHDAPSVKRALTEAAGAEIVAYDRYKESREAIGAALAEERGLTLVRPYDQAEVIAGQGTVGAEIADQAAAMGFSPGAVVLPASGGGLAAGAAIALAAKVPGCAIYTAEPTGHDDHRRSLDAGERVQNPPDSPATLCDALLAPTPGELTFAINRALLAGGLAATDADVAAAMRLAFLHLKLVVEPGGAVGLGAALAGTIPASDGPLVIVLSGGNVDAAVFAAILGDAA